MPHPGGRPSLYSDALASEFCARVAAGRAVSRVCLDPDMPSQATVYNWLRSKPQFLESYTRAREDLLEHWANEIIDIADTSAIGMKTVTTTEGVKVTVQVSEADMIEHRRLQIESRKWLLAKLAPKKYGDRLGLTDADGTPLSVQIVQFSQTSQPGTNQPGTNIVPLRH